MEKGGRNKKQNEEINQNDVDALYKLVKTDELLKRQCPQPKMWNSATLKTISGHFPNTKWAFMYSFGVGKDSAGTTQQCRSNADFMCYDTFCILNLVSNNSVLNFVSQTKHKY